MSLPGIYAPIQCDHCFSNLENVDGVFDCEPCGISWDGNPFDDVEAHFTDDESEPCGAKSTEPIREHSRYRFWDEPCTLPEGHTSSHHFPLGSEKVSA